MEVFWPNYSDPPHGQDDMRMLGPADHFGQLGESHSSLWSCLCDYTHYNMDKLGSNIFTGYGFYRGGLDELAKRNCVRNDGSLPRFGNVYRDFLRSYRSMENIDYYYWDGSQYHRRRKWVPMYEFYAPSFSEPLSNYPYLLYSYSDYTDDNSTFMHPFGCLAAESIDGFPVSETVDLDPVDGSIRRYRFNEVFRTHSTLAGIYYPMPKNPQQQLIGGNLVDIIPWYTYKNYSGPGGGDFGIKSVQWAWQEYWKPVDRQKVTSDNLAYFTTTQMGDHPTVSRLPITLTLAPYVGEGDLVSGRHAFLNIEYPNYRYDGTLKEHRLVCDEGDQDITIMPPAVFGDELGNYGDNPIWHVQLNDGPKRCFDINGAWLTTSGEECHVDLYETCTTSPWLEDVTLFDTGYDSKITNPDRTITHFDTIPPTYEYYQRGLKVTPKPGNLGFLPKRLHQFDAEHYEMRISALSTCDEVGSSPWIGVKDLTKFYPGSTDFNVVCCSDSNELTVTFKFKYPISVGAFGSNFGFGAKKDKNAVGLDGNYLEKGTVFSGTLYHLPGIKLYKSDDDNTYTSIYNLDSMKLAIKSDVVTNVDCFYELPKSSESIKPFKYLKMVLRLMPTVSEVNAVGGDYKKYFFDAINKVGLNYFYVYYNEFLEAREIVHTYERLYNVSYGYHGDFPPHGYDGTGSLLYVNPNDKSTVYQMDSIGGVVGMPNSAGECKSINKIQGRILKACHPDKEPLEGSDITKWEGEQKKIHDAIAIKSGSTHIMLRSQPPPNMKYLFDAAGVNFPSWSCNLYNTLVAPLFPTYNSASYSPCGHNYVRDLKSAKYSVCAVFGSIFGRVYTDNYNYGFKHYCGGDDVMIWTYDVLNQSHLAVLAKAEMNIRRQYDKADEVNAKTRAAATMRNLSKYSYPSPVDPVH